MDGRLGCFYLLVAVNTASVNTPVQAFAWTCFHFSWVQTQERNCWALWKLWFEILGGSDGKESACSAGDQGSIPGSGRSPGEGNGNPLQYSCLENPMDRGAWWALVHGVTVRQD